MANFLPAYLAIGVDKEGSVQGSVLKIVVSTIFTEGLQRGVAEQREIKMPVLGVVADEGVTQTCRGVGADGEQRDTLFFEFCRHWVEGVELIHTMHAAFAQVKDKHYGFAAQCVEGEFLLIAIGERPRWRGGWLPSEGAEIVKVGA